MPDNLESELVGLASSYRDAVPPRLRTRVATIAGSASEPVPIPNAASRGWSLRRSPVIAAVAFVVVVVILVAIPGARVSIARQGTRVLQSLRIAPSTHLETDDVRTAEEVQTTLREHERKLSTGQRWFVYTVYLAFGGSVPAGASADVQRIEQPDLLTSLSTIRLMAPAGEYRGEPVVFHHALLAPDGLVLAFFGHALTEILLVQVPVGHGQQMAYSRTVSGSDNSSIGIPPSIETLTVNGQQLTWDPDTTGIMPNSSALRWEANGVSYALYGRALTRDEAVALFTGLQPLR